MIGFSIALFSVLNLPQSLYAVQLYRYYAFLH